MIHRFVRIAALALAASLTHVAPSRAQQPYPMAPWPPTLQASHPLDPYWTGEFGFAELDGGVNAMLVDGHRVLLGGNFSGLGDVPARNVMAWDGTHFEPVGGGLPRVVRALASWGSRIVAGLDQTEGQEGACTNDVWTFDGTQWTPIGCFSGSVTALASFRGALVVAPFGHPLYAWDGAGWTQLATGSLGETGTLLPIGDSLFVSAVAATPSVRVWNGVSLTGVGGTLGSTLSTSKRLNSMIAWNGRPVIAGNLDTENGIGRGSTILRFDGAQWVGLGSVNGESSGLAIRNGELITSIRVGTESQVHRFTGGAWVPVDTSGGIAGLALLATIGDTIVVRSLSRIGGTVVSTPGFHAGGAWQALRQSWSPQMRGVRVSTNPRLLPWQGELLAGGPSRVGTASGSIAVPGGISRWNGSGWTPFPNAGTPPGSTTIRTDSTGALHGIAGATVVRWNGSAWAAVTPAYPTGPLVDFGFDRGHLVVGALWSDPFTSPSAIAKLESGTWQSIGDCEFYSNISVLQSPRVFGGWRGRLMVGCDEALERTCGGGPYEMSQGLAMYDGTTWSLPLAEAVGSPWLSVGTMVEHGTDLIVSGGPGTLYPNGTLPSPPLRLDGTSALPLAAGAWATTALASIQGHLFAGGVFVRPDSTLGYGLAEWNGSRWDLLGSGMNGLITSIAEHGGDVYVAGPFAWANGKPSHGVARFAGLSLLAAPARAGAADRLALGPPSPNPARGPQRVTFVLPRAGRVRASVHDVSGRRVAMLFDEVRTAGTHVVTWDGRSATGAAVAPGLYFLRVRADAGAASASLVRIE